MTSINNFFFSYPVSQVILLFLNAGYVNFGSSLVDSRLEQKVGLPQGSMLSPLFCNILLHNLDFFAISLCKKHSEKWEAYRRYPNTPWKNFECLLKSKVDNCGLARETHKTLTGIHLQAVALKRVKEQAESKKRRKLIYVRYADDFLLGFIGPKKEAVEIIVHISWFVDVYLGMVLNTDKTGARHHEKGVCFLGYKIWKKYRLDGDPVAGGLKHSHQNKFARLNFSVPLEKLFLRYSEIGFLQKARKKSTNKFVGRRQDKWVFLGDDAAIIHRFNNVLRSIGDFYSGSTQQLVLNRLYYALKKSACLTIAHRNSKRNAN